MKMNEFRRMMRNSKKEKDTSDVKDKSGRKQPSKRRAGAKGDDDESVEPNNVSPFVAVEDE